MARRARGGRRLLGPTLAVCGLLVLGVALAAFVELGPLVTVVTCGDCSLSTTSTISAEPIPVAGFGVLGDSNSDEYCGTDQRGGSFAEHTLGWVEQFAWRRGLNFGMWGEWGEPRREGFEYNWARSGATAESLLSEGQHTGLAEQVAAGQVSHVLYWIGTNDFSTHSGQYAEIYSGRLAGDALRARIAGVVAEVRTAIETVTAAGPVRLVVVTMPDEGAVPVTLSAYPNPLKRQRVTHAIDAVNEGVLRVAAEHGVAVVDINDVVRRLLTRMGLDGRLKVGDEALDVFGRNDDPHFGRLGDSAGHAGTILAGYTANILFAETFSRAFGVEIQPLTDDELLEDAGLKPLPDGVTGLDNPCGQP